MLFDKAMFDRLLVFNWDMEPMDRSIDEAKYITYINSIDDDKLRVVVNSIIQNTIYVDFSTFKYYLETLTIALPVKFNLLLDTNKIGSEHWIIALLWNKIRTKVVKIISVNDHIDNNYPIVIMDDCIYSARHSINLISELVTYHNELNYMGDDDLVYFSVRGIPSVINRTLSNEIIIACPYVSTTGIYYINNFINTTGVKIKILYNIIIKPAVLLVKEKLQGTIHGFGSTEEIVDYFINYLNAKDTNIAIYFDHKIAGDFSSFPTIYKNIVKVIPSRYKIEELERLPLEGI